MCYIPYAISRTLESLVDILISVPMSTKGNQNSEFLAPRKTRSLDIKGLFANNHING